MSFVLKRGPSTSLGMTVLIELSNEVPRFARDDADFARRLNEETRAPSMMVLAFLL